MNNVIQLSVEKNGDTLVLSFRQLKMTLEASYQSTDKTFIIPNEKAKLKNYVDEVYSKSSPLNAPNKADFVKQIINYILKINVDSVDINSLNDFLDNKLEIKLDDPTYFGNVAVELGNKLDPLKEFQDTVSNIEKKNKELYNAINEESTFPLDETNIDDEDFDFEGESEQFSRSETDTGSNLDMQRNMPLPAVGGKKPVASRSGMSTSKAGQLNNLPDSITVELKGVGGDRNIEPVPKPIYYSGDSYLESENNSGIICSRDEHYRLRPQTGIGAVYIYAGRKGSPKKEGPALTLSEQADPEEANRKKVTGEANDLVSDSAYIYVSQKSDVDSLLKVTAKGSYGKKFIKLSDSRNAEQETRKGLSLVAMKADDIVLMSRVAGIRLITAPDKKSSKAVPGVDGGEVISKFGIDLIAGNDDSDLQPLVKGENLKLYLENLSDVIDSVRAVLVDFINSQSKFNAAVMKHTHYDPYLITMGFLSTNGSNPLAFNGGKGYGSIEVVTAGKMALLDTARQQANILSIMLNRTGNDVNAFNPIGQYKILSEKNRTN
tara:strand:- start:5178 stop:6821 length:1644 start_codon:yes stop_codon:yes gene_type:complete